MNPGPVQPELILGAINPNGIMHKLDQLQELPSSTCTIYGVCESHLSKPGIAKFQRSLKLVKSHFRFHAGAPAPLRSTSFTAIGGKHTGTGWLSNTPTRPLHPTWSDDDWNEARFAMHSFLVNDQWLTGGVFYGYAQQAATQEGRNHTNALMEKVVDRLLMAKGKRFLVGHLWVTLTKNMMCSNSQSDYMTKDGESAKSSEKKNTPDQFQKLATKLLRKTSFGLARN